MDHKQAMLSDFWKLREICRAQSSIREKPRKFCGKFRGYILLKSASLFDFIGNSHSEKWGQISLNIIAGPEKFL